MSAGFVAGAGIGMGPARIWAEVERGARTDSSPTEYALTVDRVGVSFTGASTHAPAIDGQIPGPVLRLREGDDVVIRVTNRLDEETSIHWHGLLVPFDQDGVPGISYDGIGPGETFTYRFRVRQAGTYWYHSHSKGQEQRGLYGPIVIEPAADDPVAYDREHVIVLSDWTDEHPMDVLRNLKGNGGYYNYGRRTLPQLIGGLLREPAATIRDREMWGRMRMDPTDIADVTGATYTFLLNGRTAEQNWTALFSAGERVRLRLINAAAMTYFDVRIPGLRMTVVQADGQDVEPVVVDEIGIAVAETYDVVVEPEAGTAYTIFAQTLDRSGFARGTLTDRAEASAPIPPVDSRPLRTMSDMPGMAEHDTAEHATPMSAEDHAAMGHGSVGTRRKLTYSDLVALEPNRDVRAPERDVMLRLTGDMERYFWTINDKKLSQSDPIRLGLGERIRLTFVNETMMEHPMHVHGVFMELQNGQSARFAPRKHTVSVAPGQTVEAHLTFEEAGPWALHCHLLYHMMTGMFARLEVVDGPLAEER